jgi:hypothetical protein
MKKMLLSALVAITGCSSAGSSHEILSSNHQALDSTEERAPSNLPKFRKVTPGDAGTGGGTTGTGTIGGNSAWRPLTNQPNIYAGTALLLTDGTVMVQDAGTSNWWKLTPDAKGSYANGTWSTLPPMPNGYAPLYFASAVLPDGRVIVEGGEYQLFEPVWGTRGAIFDPKTNEWTAVLPPAGWRTLGDAQSVVLADGRFVVADCCSTRAAVLEPKTMTWTAFGTGKTDINDEEGWTLLPDGTVLALDANNTENRQNTELLNPATGTWTSAGNTPNLLADLTEKGGGSHEMGPAMLRPDGTVFAMGATGHSAIYDVGAAQWSAGPDFPFVAGEGQLDVADGPSALLPNGHVLAVASAGIYNSPAHVLEFDGTSLIEIAAPPGAAFDSSYNVNLLLLPSGEVLFTDFSNDLEIYAPTGEPCPLSVPVIDESCDLSELASGGTYTLSGQRLNGLSQGVQYGDDSQSATNYPIVRMTNVASGNVTFARTHDHTSMSVADIASQTSFDVPASIELGDADLVVIANGIASQPVRVHIANKPSVAIAR